MRDKKSETLTKEILNLTYQPQTGKTKIYAAPNSNLTNPIVKYIY